MEIEFWDKIEEWKENTEDSKMEVEEVPSPIDQHKPTTIHMHTSIDHWQSDIKYDGKDELNLNNIYFMPQHYSHHWTHF